ncbi:MAG: ABC transporter substrate-binding protein [Bellilinea sp.]
MFKKSFSYVFALLVIASMVLAACQPAQTTPTEAPVVEPTAVPEATTAPEPTEEPTPEVVKTTRHGGWLDEIVVSVVDSASAVTQIQAGAIDIYAAGLSSASLPEIEAAGLDYAKQNGLYYELTFNTYGPFFTDSTGKVNPFVFAKAREALNWLIDRDYINREVYNGGALPKYFSIITQFPDYANMAETVRRLEAKYAYDPEKAATQMDEVMLGIEGVTKEDGKYMFDGEQVTLIFLIRNDSDGTRVPIGDYVANQLESIGFAVDRQYKKSSEASPIWVGGNVADGLWHLYTGAWSATIIDRDEGDNFEFFDTPQSAYGFSSTWQAFNVSDRYMELADALAYNKFTTREERNAALAEMLDLAMTESIHVWLIDGKNFTPYRDGVSVTYDLAAGVDGSMIWPYTIRLTDQEGGTLKWGAPDLFVDPWNPIAGSNWAFDQAIGRATWGEAYMIDPHTGLLHPQRFTHAEITAQEGLPIGLTLTDSYTLEFVPEIAVPEDAIVDWDAANQAFVTAAEKFPEGTTAKVKSIVYYPEDLFETVKWHDGSNLSLGDFLYSWIISLDMGKPESPIYDEAYASNAEAILANYKGFRILSESPLTIEAYSDAYQTDAELNITTMWPSFNYGEAPWHVLEAGAMADAAGEVAFSPDKADAKSTDTATVEWLSLIGGPSIDILTKYMDQGIAEAHIPYANVLGDYITAEEAVARYENAKAFKDTYGHYSIGSGPYILSEVYLTEKVATLINNPDFVDLSDKWAMFGDPKVAEAELEGEGSVVVGNEFTFDVYVTFEGEPYASAEIKEVKGLLYDSTEQIVAVLQGTLVEEGYYVITVPADVSAKMVAGPAKIEAVVVPYTVAIPTFSSMEFVTIQ